MLDIALQSTIADFDGEDGFLKSFIWQDMQTYLMAERILALDDLSKIDLLDDTKRLEAVKIQQSILTIDNMLALPTRLKELLIENKENENAKTE